MNPCEGIVQSPCIDHKSRPPCVEALIRVAGAEYSAKFLQKDGGAKATMPGLSKAVLKRKQGRLVLRDCKKTDRYWRVFCEVQVLGRRHKTLIIAHKTTPAKSGERTAALSDTRNWVNGQLQCQWVYRSKRGLNCHVGRACFALLLLMGKTITGSSRIFENIMILQMEMNTKWMEWILLLQRIKNFAELKSLSNPINPE